MSVAKYGIVVPFENSFLWVCNDFKNLEPTVLLFDDKESARKEASIWGPLAKVRKYKEG